jgi:hypothetical protein
MMVQEAHAPDKLVRFKLPLRVGKYRLIREGHTCPEREATRYPAYTELPSLEEDRKPILLHGRKRLLLTFPQMERGNAGIAIVNHFKIGLFDKLTRR